MAVDFPLAINPTLQDPEWSALKNAADYRIFLRSYLEIRALNFSDFARATGFVRSYPADIISGKRRLTSKSFYAFEKALKIPQPGKKLFRLLVAEKENDLFPEMDRQHIKESIEVLRKKPWTRLRKNLHTSETPSALSLLENPDTASVFAATGSPDVGANIEEIQRRTGLSAAHLNSVLLQLRSSGLIEFTNGRYLSKDLHIFMDGADKQKLFSNSFKQNTAKTMERVEKAWNSESEFFFSSAFCIEESRMPNLKNALKETILSFIDNSIQADGDKVVQLIVAFHK